MQDIKTDSGMERKYDPDWDEWRKRRGGMVLYGDVLAELDRQAVLRGERPRFHVLDAEYTRSVIDDALHEARDDGYEDGYGDASRSSDIERELGRFLQGGLAD